MVLDIKPSCRIREIDLVYRNAIKPSEFPTVQHSKEAYDLFMESWDMDRIELQEQFRVMLMDNKGRCMGVATVATGGISDCMVDLRLVFALALKGRASSIIVSHNHPSGTCFPSEQDKQMTARIALAGDLLGMPLLDHVIVTKEGYMSFADEGLLPSREQQQKSLSRRPASGIRPKPA